MFQRQKLFTQINARSYVEQYRKQGKFLRKQKQMRLIHQKNMTITSHHIIRIYLEIQRLLNYQVFELKRVTCRNMFMLRLLNV